MKSRVCLDTGIITQTCSKKVPESVSFLMKDIFEKKIDAYVLAPIISEAYFHICNIKGTEAAENLITSFFKTYPIKIITLDQALVYKAGELKCQHRNILSYNDCFSIAYALNNKMTFHTTEKELKKILPNLKTQKHQF